MNAATHPVAPEEIMALLDGELSADPSQAVSAHIDQCDDCQELANSLRNTSAALSHWGVTPAPAQLEASVAAAATRDATLSEQLRSTRPRHTVSWGLRRSTFALVGTAALALLAIAVSIPTLHRSRQAAADVVEVGRTRTKMIKKEAPAVFTNQIPREGTSSLSSPVTLATPGAATDSNGLFHGLGDHAQNAFSVDGQPITDQQSRVFSGPMIARTVSLTINVKDFDASRSGLEAILVRHNGHSANLTVNTPQGVPRSLQASLRVPAPELAATISELKALGRVEIETQGGEEVTRQHTDLIARLKVSRETERRFLAILRERTGNVNEVLNAEEAIARLRGEIERMEAEQTNIEHRVDFATIDLTLAEEYKAQLTSPAPSVATRLRNASIDGFRSASENLLAIIFFFAESVPTLVLWLVILFLPARMIWRRYRRAYSLGSSPVA